jgi:hypothetical protein
MIKCTGAELKAFMEDSIWPEDSICEDMEFIVAGTSIDDYEEIPDDAKVGLWGSNVTTSDYGKITTLSKLFRKWKESKTHNFVTIKYPKEHEKALREMLPMFQATIL